MSRGRRHEIQKVEDVLGETEISTRPDTDEKVAYIHEA